MVTRIVERLKVIDVDTHVLEPDDVWTSRVSKKWGDLVPHVRLNQDTGQEYWYFGDELFAEGARGLYAAAGWKEPLPSLPPTIKEIDPAAYNPHERLKRMDEYGIYAQVLYPNVGGFGSGAFLKLKEPALMLECVHAYNDFLAEWCGTDPNRLIPIMALPFWDVEESVKEIHRCVKLGHKGILFGNQSETYDLPLLADPHWNPIWEVAQDNGLTINFHIGAGHGEYRRPQFKGNGPRANFAKAVVMEFMDNAQAISEVIISGLCHRYPRLNFVSVESGVGFLPFLMEALDWQWKNNGALLEHPEYDLLPSEYFRRQVYGCFWFEEASAETALRLYPDNILYETDFPHPTSMSPGATMPYARVPGTYIQETLGDLPEETLRKVLHDNAARIYHVG
jgi:predicted TIM-barrel fold metal-dependent hydrolase